MTQVFVSSTADQGMKHTVTANTHNFVSDANPENGGVDAGPNPHELMLASLGACTSMTLRVFSNRRGWKLDTVNVKLNEETVEDPNNAGKKVSKITREIEVKGDLTQEQMDTLKQIADKCPIHKLLTDASKQIVTQLESLN